MTKLALKGVIPEQKIAGWKHKRRGKAEKNERKRYLKMGNKKKNLRKRKKETVTKK